MNHVMLVYGLSWLGVQLFLAECMPVTHKRRLLKRMARKCYSVMFLNYGPVQLQELLFDIGDYVPSHQILVSELVPMSCFWPPQNLGWCPLATSKSPS